MIHIWRPLWGEVRRGGDRWDKNEMLSNAGGKGRGGELESVMDVQSLFFLLKKIGFAPWLDIRLSQTLIYYWQEIFLLTLTLGSEVILQWYHCIVCGLNRTIARVVSLNVTRLGFVFVLISFAHMHGAVVVP